MTPCIHVYHAYSGYDPLHYLWCIHECRRLCIIRNISCPIVSTLYEIAQYVVQWTKYIVRRTVNNVHVRRTVNLQDKLNMTCIHAYILINQIILHTLYDVHYTVYNIQYMYNVQCTYTHNGTCQTLHVESWCPYT